ncbi:MAG: DUF1835 domain-containing protein [Deltaproteobacteria bacterium]|nr:DUF1835 domain-containing protein [Deltaproteobacteria bacterium]
MVDPGVQAPIAKESGKRLAELGGTEERIESIPGRQTMKGTLHIIGGDRAGESLAKSGIPGEILVWHDVLYDGPRNPGWPDDATLAARLRFLEEMTGGGLDRKDILGTLRAQYGKLAGSGDHERIVLWSDACLFDQAMLVHILTCMRHLGIPNAELLCVDAFPGIEPFHGLGQLQPSQLVSLYDRRRPVTDAQFRFAAVVDRAFAARDLQALAGLAHEIDAPLPWVAAAAARWLQEQPDPATGLGRLESLALRAIREGNATPDGIFSAVAASDVPPQFWGDITLWAKINALAGHNPPLVRIEGPEKKLPQWTTSLDLKTFRITLPQGGSDTGAAPSLA